MSDIPADVVAGILSRLPVKLLLQFRCVSKSWCAIIDSTDFIKSHLNRSIETNNRSVILKYSYVSSIDFDLVDHAVEFDNPMKSEDCIETEVVGSCNGLLCLLNTNDTPMRSEDYIVLCNPSTRKRQKLPLTPIELPRESCISYGFGYDSVNDDYKVVRMVQLYGEGSFHSEVKVYSLKSNSWRRIQDFPYYLLYSGPDAILASGALHWAVCRTSKLADTAKLIAAFDLGLEEYRLVPEPEFSDKNFRMCVNVLGGCLSLLLFPYSNVRVDIWVMKEYGVKESWTNLFSLALPCISSFVRPLAYSKSGVEVLMYEDCRGLLWYDLEKKTIKYLKIRSVECGMEAVICFESLVRLRDDGESDGEKQQAEEKVKNKKQSAEFVTFGRGTSTTNFSINEDLKQCLMRIDAGLMGQ